MDSKSTIKAVFIADVDCYYCGVTTRKSRSGRSKHTSDERTIDHILPKVRGGDNSKANKVICCYSCNQDKFSLTVEEHRTVVMMRAGYCRCRFKLLFPGESNVKRLVNKKNKLIEGKSQISQLTLTPDQLRKRALCE